MRKVIAVINMTLDGICDHTAGLPDEQIHQHYTELLGKGDAILYGRITYQLMEYWRTFLDTPSNEKSMNDFAMAIDKIPKIVFSNTIKNVSWNSAKLATGSLKDEVSALKGQAGKDIFIGSRSLIIELMKLSMIDELQLCIYPMVEGKGLPLFENMSDRLIFKLVYTKTFNNGAIILYYEPIKE